MLSTPRASRSTAHRGSRSARETTSRFAAGLLACALAFGIVAPQLAASSAVAAPGQEQPTASSGAGEAGPGDGAGSVKTPDPGETPTPTTAPQPETGTTKEPVSTPPPTSTPSAEAPTPSAKAPSAKAPTKQAKVAPAQASAAALSLAGCDAGLAYGIGAPAGAGNSTVMNTIYQIDPTTGARTASGTLTFAGGATGHSADALAADAAGGYLWAVDNTDATKVLRYEAATGTTTTYDSGLTAAEAGKANTGVRGGAIDPTTGIYYFMYVDATTWTLLAFDPSTNTPIGKVRTFTGAPSAGQPDFAIDQLGNLVVLATPNSLAGSATLYRIDGPLPKTASVTSVAFTAGAKPISTFSPGTNGQAVGVAFTPKGTLLVSTRSTLDTTVLAGKLLEVNPMTGAILTTTTSERTTDLASCAGGSTLRLMKELPSGRYDNATIAASQFTLRIGGTGVSPSNSGLSGVTTGNSTGLQNQTAAEFAGAAPVVNGGSYTIAETASYLAGYYESKWACYDNAGLPDTQRGALIASGTGTSGSITVPAGTSAANVLCILTNIPKSYKITKTASPTTAAPGDTVTYTVKVENLSTVPYTSAVLAVDNLTGVLDDANYNNDAKRDGQTTGVVYSAAAKTLTLTAPLAARGSAGDTVTMTYSATVPMPLKAPAGDGVLKNSVTSTQAGSSCKTAGNAGCQVSTPLAGIGVLKVSDPASGSKVIPGKTVTYTITMQNAGASAAAVNSDDLLADVLDNGTLVAGSLSVTPSTVTAVLSGDRIQLRGTLGAQQTATVTYKVVIDGPKATTGGDVARNFVVAAGASAPASCAPGSTACTEHPVVASLCNANTIYSILGDYQVEGIDIASGTKATALPALSDGMNYNGLAVSDDGQYVFAYQRFNSSGTNLPAPNTGLYVRDAQTGATVQYIRAPLDITVVMGAYNSANGHYYSGSLSRTAYSNPITLTVRDFNLGTGTYVEKSAQIPAMMPGGTDTGHNGDFAFDSLGNLYVLVHTSSSQNLYEVIMYENAAPAGSTTIDLSKPKVVVAPTAPPAAMAAMVDGIAFGGDGLLYIGSTGGMIVIDPNTGERANTQLYDTANSMDLASCGSVPHTLELRKELPNGRFVAAGGAADGDQFKLTVGFAGKPDYSTATTAGTAVGMQPQKAGPVPMVLGREYSFSEAAAGTTNLTNYTSTWVCVNSGRSGAESLPLPAGTVTSSGQGSGTGTSGTISIPVGVDGPLHIVCTLKNVPKGAVPDPGSVVWQKVDSANPSRLLGGSEWTLTPVDASGNPGTPLVVTDCVAASAAACTGTDRDPAEGRFLLEGIPLGSYRLKETKAPAGFQLLTDPIDVTVNQSTAPTPVGVDGKVRNSQMTVPQIPLTGGVGTLMFVLGAGGIAVIAAAVIIVQRRRNRDAAE